jgi:hypothetical protein
MGKLTEKEYARQRRRLDRELRRAGKVRQYVSKSQLKRIKAMTKQGNGGEQRSDS